MQERIEWIDVAKGIGMFLVIAGHTVSLRYCYPLYAFHMPLFFFLSGLVFKNRDEDFAAFVRNKTKSLIRPWAIILFISFLVCLLIPQWRNALTGKSILIDFYTANTNTLQNSSLWYLICFFFVFVLFFFLNRIRHNLSKTLLLCLLAIVVLWIRELLDLTPLPLHRLPFKIDSALIALVFFTVGYEYKEKIKSLLNVRKSSVYIILFVVMTAYLCILNGWSNINSLDFGELRLLFYPIAFLGIASVCLVSQYISTSKNKVIKIILCFYGKNSLLIFGFQSLFIRLYLLFFSYLQGLHMVLYGDNPIIHQFGSFFVVSFVMSPLVVYFFDSLRKRNILIL